MSLKHLEEERTNSSYLWWGMKKTRADYQMVPEDDPQWVRFWASYPRRVSKKDARKTWLKLNPSPELVDQMIAALAWQTTAYRWDSDKMDYAPFPSSWLNGERWTDEPPRAVTKAQAGKAAVTVLETLLGDGRQ